MIGYVTLGTNTFGAALEFYEALFSSVGVTCLCKRDQMAAWGCSRVEPAFCIASPFDGEPASVGNGAVIALKMADRMAVDRLYAKCFEHGGLNEGHPRPRGDHGFYASYFQDLDGNTLNAHVPA